MLVQASFNLFRKLQWGNALIQKFEIFFTYGNSMSIAGFSIV